MATGRGDPEVVAPEPADGASTVATRVVEAVPYGILAFDRECRYTAWNPAMERLSGLSADQVLGRVAWEAFPFLKEIGEDQFFHVALAGETDAVSEQPFSVPETGRTGFFQARYSPLRDDQGRIFGGMALVRDVTESRRSDEALRMQGRVLESMGEGVSVSDENGFILYTNPAEDRMFGYRPGELLGQHVTVLNSYPPEENQRMVAEVIAALKQDGVWTGEWINRRKDGSPFTTFARITALEISGRHFWVCVQEDITRRRGVEEERAALLEGERAARARVQLLADAGTVFASSVDLRAIFDALTRLVVPRLADWCFVETPTADGRIELVSVHHSDPAMVELARQVLRRYPVDPAAAHGTGKVLRTGQPEMVAEIPDALLEAVAQDAEHLALLRGVGFRSYLSLPLQMRGGTLGALSLVMAESGRRFTPEDQQLAEELARRAALALDNARLFEAEQHARLAAERTADRSRRLQTVAAALNESVTPAEVAEVCVMHGMAALGADAGSLAVLTENGAEAEIVHSMGFPSELTERWRRFPVRPGRPLSDAVLSRSPVLIGGRADWEATYPATYADLVTASTAAFAAIPVVVGGRSLAGLSFSFRSERRFDEGDRTFLATLGEQAAQALERARLYEAERRARSAAERLQALTAGLSEALTTTEVGETALKYGVVALGADAGVIALTDDATDEMEIVVSMGYPPEACMGPGRRWPLSRGIPIAEAARTGQGVFLDSPQAWGSRYLGGHAPRNSSSAAWAALPLMLDGRPAGALLWTYHAPRGFRAEEVVLMETIARQCSQALERARLLEAERRARAEAEAARQAAEQANQAKTEFLSAMSHELRTPLNAIAGYIDLLDLEIRGPINDAQRTDLGRIKRAQRVLLGLINDVLNFARLEAGRIEYRSEPVVLAPLLDGLEAMIEPQARIHQVTYRCGPAADELTVLGDPERIQQILLNLLSNAVKFTGAGGAVDVTASCGNDGVRIQVSDTGRGIPPDKLESIFDPFVQLERHRTEASQQGVGLGLAISRELARGMGGDLIAKSEVGHGSRFTLILPQASQVAG